MGGVGVVAEGVVDVPALEKGLEKEEEAKLEA